MMGWSKKPWQLTRYRGCGCCGVGFDTINPVKLFCSVACRKTYTARLRHMKWVKEKRLRVVVPILCCGCGKEFITDDPKRKYCSLRCRSSVGRRQLYKRVMPALDARNCVVCGEKFNPTNHKSAYCTKECRLKQRRDRKRKARAEMRGPSYCVVCGKLMDGQHRQICSDECRKIRIKEHNDSRCSVGGVRSTSGGVGKGPCIACGEPILVPKFYKYCSKGCQRKTNLLSKVGPKQRTCPVTGLGFVGYGIEKYHPSIRVEVKRAQDVAHLRRKRKVGVPVVQDFYLPLLVFSRDGYVCQICGRKCSRGTHKKYRPDRVTIDHIIPLSRGGNDTLDNVQTACNECNSRVGAKTKGKQLRLCHVM